jgi:arylsulfatase A-like enzyme/phage tail protein X
MMRVVATLLAGFLLASTTVRAEGTPPPSRARGVVFVLIDTLRADHVGAHGDDRGLTPNIDRLARQGVVFERATAASSWTRTSVASIFTGLYPETHGVVDREHSLPPDLINLAEVVRDGGGLALAVQSNVNVAAEFGFDRGFAHYVTAPANAAYPGEDAVADAVSVTDRALALVDEHPPGERPFFLYVHYVDPHDPYLPHPELGRGPLPEGRYEGDQRTLRRLEGMPASAASAADRARIRRLYEDEVLWVDRHVGRLLAGLEERGLAEEAMILVTSDHGEGLWDHRHRTHGKDLYEEQIHVPLIVRWPATFAIAPQRAAARVGHVDLPSTVVKALGLAAPLSWQGHDLAIAARGEVWPRAWSFASLELDSADEESILVGDHKLIRSRKLDEDRKDRIYTTVAGDSVRGLSWKFFASGAEIARLRLLNPGLPENSTARLPQGTEIRSPDNPGAAPAPPELYDLSSDADESGDRSAADTVTRDALLSTLRDVRRHLGSPRVESPRIAEEKLSDETRGQLKALGYMD